MIPDKLCNPYFEDCDDECIPNVDLGCFCEAEGCFFRRDNVKFDPQKIDNAGGNSPSQK